MSSVDRRPLAPRLTGATASLSAPSNLLYSLISSAIFRETLASEQTSQVANQGIAYCDVTFLMFFLGKVEG
jgi:hypothetical protein